MTTIGSFTRKLFNDTFFTMLTFSERKNSPILGLAFDQMSQTIFWTEEKFIMKMQISKDGKRREPITLIKFEDEAPRGIALDICNR